MVDSVDYMDKRVVRFDSKCKMNTSSHMESTKDKIRIECRDKAKKISDQLSVTLSDASAVVARMQDNLEVDLVLDMSSNLYP